MSAASAPATALHVPIEVHAMPLTPAHSSTLFQRRTPDFGLALAHIDPEPAPFADAAPDFATTPANHGVYVQWTLPAALRCAVASSAAASRTAVFPPVPNRWLLVRSGDGGTAAWVIDSDYADGAGGGTSPYVVHGADGLKITAIGRCKDRAQWTAASNHEGDRPTAPLTAVGPGLPMFAAYQPYNANVFSFHDPLTPGIRAHDATLHYSVVGWRAEKELDVLHWNGGPSGGPDGGPKDRPKGREPATPAELAAALGWHAAGGGFGPRTVYAGAVRSVAWSTAVNDPADTVPSKEDCGIAVGPTAIDAFAAAFTSLMVPSTPG
ncbi:hypothetical protein [Streptomyces sp. XD-27]|uniref:hypothetical protein n=1 Tax=Streptomyces sp. XD-27 TaxID=3062779 RepID=UPI0026F44D0C|nr:hypothetical protein [Streptomyces sp. XD-27]WKX74068.1 hypothetical protein Q3Y56_33150 [Streptomyces sp. XD-27]